MNLLRVCTVLKEFQDGKVLVEELHCLLDGPARQNASALIRLLWLCVDRLNNQHWHADWPWRNWGWSPHRAMLKVLLKVKVL